MAFVEVTLPVSRHKFFSYFATNTTDMAENFVPGYPFEIKEIRVHLSTVHISVVDFIGYASANQTTVLGSIGIYDTALFSYAINGSTDYIWRPSMTMFFNYNDTLHLSMSMEADNTYGLIIQGWSITA